ncbi:hypothetical protein D9758_000038 [Tetrapyrgos nigripes]|uniref:Uncharacterized protein n=1 Tax=Tetrapyrgos nigripes TaxID=182062 RepID=A0A8H5H1U4_9AGAR|nr:hypothetical protein D9758_000038 [Tetrapyrgos nigripes]
MGEKAASRPWSKEEDDLLKCAIETHGYRDNWKAVAAAVPGRTNKACRKRWLHSLSPGVKKTAWSAEEDRSLIDLYNLHGPKWSYIARQIPGRTDDACSKRYNEALDPNLKRHSWTPDEDNQLLLLHVEMGEKWVDIGKRLQRGGLACRNRYKLLERKGLIYPVPYYPPESYHLFQPENGSSSTFREPTPTHEVLPPIRDPPPFQFSSSSLSAALDDPPRISNVSVEYLNANSVSSSPASQPPTTPGSHSAYDTYDEPMSLDDSAFQTDLQDLSTVYIYDGEGFVSDPAVVYPSGPSRLHLSDAFPASESSYNKSPQQHIPALEEIHSEYITFAENSSSDTSPDIHALEELPSTSSSPLQFIISSTTSPSSPDPDLPSNDTSFSGSLLFSANPSAPSSDTRPRTSVLRNRPQSETQHRLSSSMPILPDGSIRPYACGYPSCWPSNSLTSRACFATSRELFEHNKLHEHNDPEIFEEKPYRCALPDCGRSWKSMNGLQYHLQVSTAHFQQALSSRESTRRADENDSSPTPSTAAESSQDSSGSGKRFTCDQPGCSKGYKTASGLRYHKQHGHPKKIPMQLPNVPPALVRDLNKKSRPKGVSET